MESAAVSQMRTVERKHVFCFNGLARKTAERKPVLRFRGQLLIPLIAFFAAAGVARADFNAGIEAFNLRNYETAYAEWLPLAQQGDPSAQYNLGLLYHYGLGLRRDEGEAAKWYGLAAEQGDPDAQFQIGNFYSDGFWGSESVDKAVIWYEMAAAQGHQEALAKLGGRLPDSAPVAEDPAPDVQEATIQQPPLQGIASGDGHCRGDAPNNFKVSVDISIPPAPINRDRSSVELTQASFHNRSGRILGLMVPDLDIHTQGHYVAETVSDGEGYCFWVQGIDVTLRYNSVEIYVASDYKKNSCAYREILRHEKQHVQIAQDNLDRYKPKVRFALTSLLIPKAGSPVRVESQEAAEQELQRLYERLLQPVYEEMLTALRDSQGAIDTPQEYRRVQSLCKHW